MLKPMLPTLVFDPPTQGKWLYEIKYDGFRGILEWKENECFIWSRNGKNLLPQFPELEEYLKALQEQFHPWLPLKMDGELVILENDYKANFSQIQIRGRLKAKSKIKEAALQRSCRFLVFDLLEVAGQSNTKIPYVSRKEQLFSMLKQLDLPLSPTCGTEKLIQFIPNAEDFHLVTKKMYDYNSEGIVAKQDAGTWEEGKRSRQWVKIKNWKTLSCFITGYDEENQYFYIAVYKDEQRIMPLGGFVNGLDTETKDALRKIVINNSHSKKGSIFRMEPAICIDLYYLEWKGEQLREPFFNQLRLDLTPDQCSFNYFLIKDAAFPQEIDISHPEKQLWAGHNVTKVDYLRYLRKIAPYLLPFLENRLLTVIRAPHGEFGDYFYQKNKPDSAPDFVKSIPYDDNHMIVCDTLETLIWLGNQLAIEYHIPFQTVDDDYVSEIVIDLDPPSQEHFQMAVEAAAIIKKILDSFSLTGFVKFSGNKGMQVYIPLPDSRYTWEETRIFTEFLAKFLVSYNPALFTIERLKKNRHGRLYVDFIQHAEGKTIIAPYSVRLPSKGLVAAPLYWHEINEQLNPKKFTIAEVNKRIETIGNPFAAFFYTKKHQPFAQVLKTIQNDSFNS
ncbi:bifunctional non-homologous end joining protein LigD [Lederbergia galactosidilyticus]|uniref:DNA ligase D n=1 Tax=Lederbergia galactosidilytica TaxID=217031 RepID=UPI001AE8A7DA|nr:DNA ligase D [Lederbergia galactosidilytica]MBP1916627.1 bifunctional non-homologous end joining protein LigD [Lederbergia galactosidilytica]